MKIVVAYKWAPDPQDATVSDDGVVQWSAKRSMSEYDPVAIRVGRLLADATGAELIGLTAGEAAAGTPKAIQAAASRGLDRTVVVADDALAGASPETYGAILAAAIEKIGDVDLVITGEASADVSGKAVPGLMAGHLGWPAICNVTSVSGGAGSWKVERMHRGGAQVLAIPMAAVLSVTTDAESIPLVGMKDMMAARKKPSEALALADLDVPGAASTVSVIGSRRPKSTPRKHIMLDSETAAADLVAHLRDEGVL